MHVHRNQPEEEKKAYQEPVYVDDIFPPDEEVLEEFWEDSTRDEMVEDNKTEAILDDILDDYEDENLPDKPSQEKSHPKKYRVKIPATSSRRLHYNSSHSTPKNLPRNLSTPPKQKPQRELQTGSWPVDPGVKRNGSIHKDTGSHSNRQERMYKDGRSSSTSRGQNGNFIPPPTPDKAPEPRDDKSLPDSSHVIENLENLSEEHIPLNKPAPPPVLPFMPVKSTTPHNPVFPVEKDLAHQPSQEQKQLNGVSFRPLVDEISAASEEDETTYETERDQVNGSLQGTNLNELIERLHLPVKSLILGVCKDGLPLLLELSDPSPGALLFLGDDVNGLRDHLQAVLASLCLLSDPKQVQIDVISPQPETFAMQKIFSHVQNVHLPNQDEVFDLLGCLFEITEQRQRKDNSLTGRFFSGIMPSGKGPVRILLIDQVEKLVEHLASESLAYLRWLLRRGPAAGVWVLASLDAQNAQNLDRKTLRSFGLQVAGKVRKSRQTTQLTEVPLEELASLKAGEACLKLEEEVIRFSVLNI